MFNNNRLWFLQRHLVRENEGYDDSLDDQVREWDDKRQHPYIHGLEELLSDISWRVKVDFGATERWFQRRRRFKLVRLHEVGDRAEKVWKGYEEAHEEFEAHPYRHQTWFPLKNEGMGWYKLVLTVDAELNMSLGCSYAGGSYNKENGSQQLTTGDDEQAKLTVHKANQAAWTDDRK